MRLSFLGVILMWLGGRQISLLTEPFIITRTKKATTVVVVVVVA